MAAEPIVLNTEEAREITVGETPVINWEKVSIGILQSMGRYRVKPQRLNVMMRLFSEGRLPDKHVEELLELSAVDWDGEADADTRKLFASCVVSVPRDWFVVDAPKSLDFGNPETYLHLKAKAMQKLAEFIQAGETASGN
jgi:hypothetical protein